MVGVSNFDTLGYSSAHTYFWGYQSREENNDF